MPPKKKTGPAGAAGMPIENDLSDLMNLPKLNDFVFTNLYAFKYRRNQKRLEKAIFKEFYVNPEGETAELAKRNKVIQLSDILNQAKLKAYLTEEEAADLDSVNIQKK